MELHIFKQKISTKRNKRSPFSFPFFIQGTRSLAPPASLKIQTNLCWFWLMARYERGRHITMTAGETAIWLPPDNGTSKWRDYRWHHLAHRSVQKLTHKVTNTSSSPQTKKHSAVGVVLFESLLRLLLLQYTALSLLLPLLLLCMIPVWYSVCSTLSDMNQFLDYCTEELKQLNLLVDQQKSNRLLF